MVSADEIIKCERSNECTWAFLWHRTVLFKGFSCLCVGNDVLSFDKQNKSQLVGGRLLWYRFLFHMYCARWFLTYKWMEIFCFLVSNQISFSFPLNWKKLMETQVRDHSLPKSSEQVLESVMTRDFSADVTAPLLITSITKTSMCYSNFL